MGSESLLTLLADGEYHSGESLGASLGVSRMAVWKQLQKLGAELGLPIESARGTGYRIAGGLDLLDGEAVLAAMPSGLLGSERLEIYRETDSTNRVLLDRAMAGDRGPRLCAAEFQTGGRGRRGKTWVSPYAANLYFSLLWSSHRGVSALEGLSLVVGVAVARVLRRNGVEQCLLKWPNDVWVSDRKIAGILIEVNGDADGECQIVVGVGLNVAMPEAAGGAIDQPWTDLRSELGRAPARSTLLGELVTEILQLLAQFTESGFTAFQEEWQALDAFKDRPASIHLGPRLITGVARGVDRRGALLLDTDAGREAFSGGELSLRLAP